jgi:hypothetical protein
LEGAVEAVEVPEVGRGVVEPGSGIATGAEGVEVGAEAGKARATGEQGVDPEPALRIGLLARRLGAERLVVGQQLLYSRGIQAAVGGWGPTADPQLPRDNPKPTA